MNLCEAKEHKDVITAVAVSYADAIELQLYSHVYKP